MHVLHVSSEHPPQQVFGLGRYVSDLSRELAGQGHEVHVLTNSIGGKDQDVVDHGVFVHRVDFPPPPKPPGPIAPVMAFNLHLQQRARALGREGLGDPDVVVSHDWLTALAGHRLARRWDMPHVWTVHDTVHGKRLGNVEDSGDKMTFEVERWATDAADLVLVNSRSVRDEVRRVYGGESGRIKVVHCAVDPDGFVSMQPAPRIEAFRRVFAGPEELLVTYAGRLDLEKGIDTLINAFSALREEIPRTRLAIAGRGALRETIELHVKELHLEEAVTLHGYLRGEVLKHFYIVSDIHVCPSYYEPFGLVAAEAMAAGTSVVASATGGLEEVVSKRSVGRLFPPRDVKALTKALLELGKDAGLRERLGQAAARHVRERFSWRVIAARAAEYYETALRKERLRA